MIESPERLLNGIRDRIGNSLARRATVPVIVLATALATAFAAAVAAVIALMAGHPLFPGITHAAVSTALLAPPAAFLFLEVVRQLSRTERQLESALLVNESRFDTLARISPVGIFQTDSAGLCIFVNDRWREIAGLRPAEAAGDGWARSLHPEDRARVFAEWQACTREGRGFRSEYRFRRADGTVTWVLGQAEAKRSGNGEIVGYFGTLTDITLGKESEAALQRTNRALKVVSECNEALVRITDEAELLGAICRIIVETGHHRMAWVGFACNDEAKTVRPVAKWGFDEGYFDEVQVSWGDRNRQLGPAAYAIRNRTPYVIRDTATDANIATWRENALARGFASVIALPLQIGSNAIGILGIYAPVTNAFDEEEVCLLAGLAGNLSHGIAALRARAENALAAEAVRASEKALQRTNRALKVVSECNEALVRIADENELLHEICRVAVETGHYEMAWVAFAMDDEEKSARPVAKWGRENGYLARIKVGWGDNALGQGPIGTAIRMRQAQLVRDAATDPVFAPWREQALEHGYVSILTLPIANAANVFGALAIYAPEPSAFDDEEVRLLAGVADNLARGIDAIRARAENARAAEAIRESEERFRAIFEHSAVGISQVSPDWRYLRVNQKFCEITGYSRSELLKLSFTDITHPSDLARDEEHARRVLSGDLPTSSFEKRYVRKDGSIIWVNRTISLVRDAAGNPKHYISVVQDITAAKKMEDQLRQAQKMEAVGQLTGGVAHDFNNLLTVVLGNLELLRDNPKADVTIRDLATRAIAAADRGAALTQRLLAFSRKQVLQPELTDINKLVENMNDLLRRSLGETIRVETKLAENLPEAMIDPVQLETALLNLAVNARDAMPRGGVLGFETGHSYLDQIHGGDNDDVVPGEYLLLSVTDTGTGMTPDVRERVFEPFFTTKDVGKGSGLGLSMVYGFVKQSGGHVSLSSEPGQGTTVRIYLPCATEKPSAVAEAERARPRPAGESILVVENDAEVRALATRLLREMGYNVIEASNSRDAIAILDRNVPFDLLLADVSLAGDMNGMDIAREILRRRPDTKVLFASGFKGVIPQIVPAADNGGPLYRTQVLAKPFHRSELAAQVREALET